MPRPKGHIASVAEQFGKSSNYVRSVIKKHPELGIVLEARAPTVLDHNQISALCSVIEKELEQYQAPSFAIIHNQSENEVQSNRNIMQSELQQELKDKEREIEELKSQLAQVKMDAAVAAARAEERSEAISLLRESQGQTQKLLEAAQEEASSYRPSMFGFYRKKE